MTAESCDEPLKDRVVVDQIREEQTKQPGHAESGGRVLAEGQSSARKEWLELLFRAGFWALLIYQFVFQVSVVRGRSMEPNFLEYDRLLIDKLTYALTEPQVGDVIVFEAMVPRDGRYLYRDYIKRIIGKPLDRVQVTGGKISVNGKVIPEPWGPNPFINETTGEYVVPPGRFFVLGDHRSDSEDSRRGKIGFVPESRIKGKVRWRFFPLARLKWF